MEDNFLTAMVGLLGILTGALSQAWLGVRAEKARFVRDQKLKAYTDLLAGMADLSMYSSNNEKGVVAKALVASARLRIALFGSSNSIGKLGLVFEKHSKLDTDIARLALSDAVAAMRADLHKGSKGVRISELERLVFSSYKDVGL